MAGLRRIDYHVETDGEISDDRQLEQGIESICCIPQKQPMSSIAKV